MRTVTQVQYDNAKALLNYLQGIPQSRLALNTFRCDAGCGTIACALGHATEMPLLKRQGLAMAHGPSTGGLTMPSVAGRDAVTSASGLFGSEAYTYLFSRRDNSPYDELLQEQDSGYANTPDKTVACFRLKRWLADSTIDN